MTKNNQHYKNEGRGEIPFKLLSKKRLITIALAGAVVTTPLIFTGCADGKDGVNGADGTIWKSGTSYTEFSDAKVGDYFIDTDDYILYQKTTDSWSIVMENYGKQGNSANAPVIEINADGYWTIDGVETTIKATGENGTKWHSGVVAPTTEGDVGDYYLCTENYDIYEKYDNGWTKIGNIESSNAETEQTSKQIGEHYMISDGLTEMAANAVELVVDDNTGIAYAVYLASETALGESSSLVKMAKFNILQPTNIEWVTVFDKSADFGGQPLSECNIIELNSTTVRVFAVNKSTWTYYYKDVNKKTLSVGTKNEVKFKSSESSDAVSFSKSNLNAYISSIGGTVFNEVQSTTKIIEVDGCYYTTVVGGNNTQNVLFMKSENGATWTLQSVINHRANYEAMLEYHDGKFWVMCRNGGTSPSNNKQQNLMYSEDGITWTQSNLELETSDTRPYLFRYQGELYLAYSSPMSTDYSTVRNWRCNIHIGKIVSSGGQETFDEVIYKESKFGIVYYALHDWYGNMVMLYSSGELNPTEGLMGGWSQGKDCLNYTILKSQEPELSFKALESISITSLPSITEYAVGDTFSADGLVVKAKFSDDSYSNVTNYELSTPDMTTPGTKTITVTYTVNSLVKTATFDITVSEIEKVLDSIDVTSQPTKTTYILNEEFSSEGLVVKAIYNIGSPVIITNYTLSTPDMTTVGTKTVTVSYIEGGTTKITSFDIEVVEESQLEYIELESIIADGSQYIDTGYTTTANTKIVVELDKPNDDGLTGGKWLFNSSPKSANKNFGLNLQPSGAYVLDIGNTRYNTGTINWQNGKNTITIGNGVFEINGNALVTGLNVTTTPSTSTGTLWFLTSAGSDATTYLPTTIYSISIYEGETLVKHLIPAQERTGDCRIGFYDTVGEEFIFSAKSSFINGSIENKELSSIEVTTLPTKTSYELNETFSSEGLVVTANFTDSTSAVIGNYTLSNPNMTTAGTKVVTITYTLGEVTKTTSFEIQVSEATYTSIEYITANGSSYIDTGYTTTANTKVVVEMDKPENEDVPNGKWLFSSASGGTNATTRNYGFCIKPDGAYVLDIGGTRYETGTINWKEGKNTITIGNGVFTINDTALVNNLNVTTTPQTSGNTLYLLQSPTSSNKNVSLAGTIYKVAIYEGDTLVMNLVPSKKDGSNEVGLYDTISGQFFDSETETGFIAGPEVVQE